MQKKAKLVNANGLTNVGGIGNSAVSCTWWFYVMEFDFDFLNPCSWKATVEFMLLCLILGWAHFGIWCLPLQHTHDDLF